MLMRCDGGDYVVGAEGFTAIIAIGANYFHSTEVFRVDGLTGGAVMTWYGLGLVGCKEEVLY